MNLNSTNTSKLKASSQVEKTHSKKIQQQLMDNSEMYSNKSLSEAIRDRVFAGTPTPMRRNDTEKILRARVEMEKS